jgi:predicted RND superfamily exporter protein
MNKMTEKQLIAKLKQLKEIKPSENWVCFVKDQILKEENPIYKKEAEFNFSFISFIKELQKGERFVFQHKPAFAFLTVLLILIGVFGFAQSSVPGDSLFTLKKIAEQSQSIFVSEENQPKRDFELANKRLDDLTKIAQENSVDNLAPAINEYQESVSKAAESLAKEEKHDIKEISAVIKELEKKEEAIKSLGVEIGDKEKLNNVLADIVATEISDLDKKTLTEEQKELLIKIKQNYEQGNYSQALEEILLFNNQ